MQIQIYVFYMYLFIRQANYVKTPFAFVASMDMH